MQIYVKLANDSYPREVQKSEFAFQSDPAGTWMNWCLMIYVPELEKVKTL